MSAASNDTPDRAPQRPEAHEPPTPDGAMQPGPPRDASPEPPAPDGAMQPGPLRDPSPDDGGLDFGAGDRSREDVDPVRDEGAHDPRGRADAADERDGDNDGADDRDGGDEVLVWGGSDDSHGVTGEDYSPDATVVAGELNDRGELTAEEEPLDG